jgi:hypothetical protein
VVSGRSRPFCRTKSDRRQTIVTAGGEDARRFPVATTLDRLRHPCTVRVYSFCGA